MDKPLMIMMCGLPGSGKSTQAVELAKFYHANIHSSDDIRQELFTDVDSVEPEQNQKVFKLLHERVKEDLRKGQSTIYDATNISWKRRKAFLDEIKSIDCVKLCYVVLAPYAICLENNKMRKRHVPESVIENMYKNWYTPYCYEGWDDITLWYSSEYADDLQIKGWVDRMKSFDQQNSYHNLTLGDHCECVQEYFGRYCDNGELFRGHINELHDAYSACLLHDCGKPFTKEIRDGEAHYYGHQCVGAYDSLFFQTYNLKDPLFRSVLVNWHMQPYSWEGKENSKTERKYKRLWGDRLYNIIMLLHEADVNAH
ncbi:MAG: hypothetical protein [Bacteriophage sp.]|nr:MAG: hypothetical protein [Bacteriophage sp.]